VSDRRNALSLGPLADTLRVLVVRELHVRYKSSVLGLLWAVLSPLGTVVILHLLFTRIVPLDIPHYASFIYSGLLPWVWFQSTVQTAAAALSDHRDLVRKPFFVRPVLPAVVTISHFLLYLLALPVFVALLLVESVRPSAFLLALPLVWLVEGLFALACAVLVSALGALIRDVQHLLGVVMMLWFYLTPVFYDLGRVNIPETRWLHLNPLTVVVEAHRAVTLQGRAPDWVGLAVCAAAATILLLASLRVFRALEPLAIEEV
jgi:ABC-type polysaccharide/polyol phosphate export permease